MQTKFEEVYNALNNEQKKAVDTIEGPVMVVAGPGTGKTQVLTLRIANILQKTDTAPENILALTFTDAAGQNMRRRLSAIIGSRAYHVAISTFHSFCEKIIREYPEYFPKIIGSRAITEVDQAGIIENLIDTLPAGGHLDLLRPYGDPYLYVKSIISSIGSLKREGVMSEEFAQILDEEERAFLATDHLYHEKGAYKGKMKGAYQKYEKLIAKNRELCLIYESYEKECAKRRVYDFSDMLVEVLRALRDNLSFLQILQETYQYILVDEHQDTNNVQNKIMEILLSFHKNPNIFVVGDEKQAIFRFQGASLENFRYFKHIYPNAKLITLLYNYRSTQRILDSAESVLPSPSKALLVRQPADFGEAKEGSLISVIACRMPESERFVVASNIKKLIENSVPPEEIAILYRTNEDAFPMARMLGKLKIPHIIESDRDILADQDVKKLIIILRAVADFGKDELLAELLHVDALGIHPLDTFRLIRATYDKKKPLIEIISNKKFRHGYEWHDADRIDVVAKFLARWTIEAKNAPLLDVVEKILNESGLLQAMIALGNAPVRFEAMRAFFDEIQSFIASNPEATLSDLFRYLDTVRRHKLLLKRWVQMRTEGFVRLMTVHRAKGLEFEHVFIIHASSGHFGDRRTIEKLALVPSVYWLTKNKEIKKEEKQPDLEEDNDERRLFYVALTRAKESVTISYSELSEDGREQLPTSFVTEIKPELVKKIEPRELENEFEKRRAELAGIPAISEAEGPKGNYRKVGVAEAAFVRELFLAHGLSPTALNNYLECPWRYFYQNLVRIPSALTKEQCYGIAVHAAIHDLFCRAPNEEVDANFFLASFEGYLNKQQLSLHDREELISKAKKSLLGWFEANENMLDRPGRSEFRINGILIRDDVRLTGILDRMEFINSSEVNVIDFKTGKPKTRNDIMGETKTSEGNYYRQLVFYKLLLDKYEDGKYRMLSGEINFTEPNEKKDYKKEIFEITDNEVEELKEQIIKVADEILSLSFWDRRCDKKDCKYCALRSLLAK